MIPKTIKRGDTGAEVAQWQGILDITADAVFGAQTDFATKAWQTRHGLIADGIVGPISWGLAIGRVKTDPFPPPPELLKGTDLSAIQGTLSPADWKAMADLGIKFAIMRLVVGNESWTDSGVAKKNADLARAHGIACGAYFFPYPLPHLDPRQQVERFVRVLEGLGLSLDQLPPAFDAEWPPREEWKKKSDGTKELVYPWKKWGCSPPQLREWILTALERGEELTGLTWLVYTYRYWLKCIEGEKAGELAKRPLWLADYTFKGRWPSAGEAAKLKPPAPWDRITIVQHDGDGGLKLPNGRDADFNVMLGGQDALIDLTKYTGLHGADDRLPASLTTALTKPGGAALIMPDEEIASYRRERIEDEPAAA